MALCVSVAQTLGLEYKLWVEFGTGKHFHYLAAHSMVIGPKKAKILPMFHAFTGCDTVSRFIEHSKKTTWAIWNVLPELTDALLKLSSMPSVIEEDVMRTICDFDV